MSETGELFFLVGLRRVLLSALDLIDKRILRLKLSQPCEPSQQMDGESIAGVT